MKIIRTALHPHFGIRTALKKITDMVSRRTDAVLHDRLYIPLRIYLNRKIIHHYGGDYRVGNEQSHNLDISMGGMGYGEIQYSLIRALKPKNILCIGSMYGFIPFMLARACADNGCGTVQFVDAAYGVRKEKKGFNKSFWNTPEAQRHFTYLLSDGYLTHSKCTSAEFAATHTDTVWDYIYIDGDHSYRGVSTDFELFWRNLSADGILLIHDIFTSDTPTLKYGTRKFWIEIAKNPKYHAVSIPGTCGIGIVRK